VGFDGETRHAVVSSTPVTYEGDPAVQSVLTDVTDQRRAEQELREERAFTERALNALDDIFWVAGPSGQFRRWNDQMTAISGYTDEEVGEMYPTDFVVDEDVERIADALVETIEEERATTEVTMETKDGECIPYELVGTTITDDEGSVVALCGTGRDLTERKQRERELERYERLVETVDDALYTVDDEGRFTFVNESFVGLTGHDRAELVGSGVSVLKDAATVEQFEEEVRAMLRGDHDETYVEFDLRTARGETVPCEDHMVLQTDDGTYAGVAGVIRDVTERKQRERTLERERERFATLFENIPDPTVCVDAADDGGTIRSVNDAFEDAFGYTAETMVGGSLNEFIVPSEKTQEAETLDHAIMDSEVVSRELRRKTADGNRRDFLFRTAMVDEESNEVFGIYTDITERKERERELERYETAIEAAPVGVFVLDPEATITWCNERAASLVGHAADDLIEEPFVSLIEEGVVPEAGAADYDEILRALLSADADRTAGSFDLRATPSGEDPRALRVHVSLLPHDEGFQGAVLVSEDITEHKQHEAALERERNNLAALFENVSDAVYRYRPTPDASVIEAVNPAFEERFGFESEDTVGNTISDVLVPSDRAEEYNDIKRRADAGNTLDMEVERKTTDGRRTFLLRSALIEGTTDDERQAGYAIYTDITERKQRERDLERERERFATLFENVPNPAVFADLGGGEATIESINEAFEDTFGYAEAAVVGESLNDLIVPPAKREEAESLDTAAIEGEWITQEVTRRTADGEHREFLFSNATVDGESTVAFGVYTDITAQKRRERVLTDLHDRTREMMATEDPETVASIAVEAAESVLGLPLCGLWLADDDGERLLPAATAERDDTVIDEMPIYEPGNSLSWGAFANGELHTYDDLHDADLPADTYNPETPLRSEMILPLGEFGVLNIGSTTPGEFDATDEALAQLLATNVEAALERAEREQERAARKRLLEQQNERLEEFASVVSHDLRNPLTVINGRLELLAEDYDSPHIQPIADALDRMDDLIEECLTFARQGQVVTEPARVALEESAERAWATVDTGDADLSVGDLGTVEADEERLRTLFENLFRNAIEHGSASTIRVGSLDAAPGFYVADDGSGVPESDREAVFERGYSTNEDGTGLGLAIVATLADAHGWAIDLADGESGARFEIAVEPTIPQPVRHPDV